MNDREMLERLIAIGGFFSRSADAEKCVDHLLANGVIVLPCRPGDTVYEVKNNTDACDDCPSYFCGFGDCWCDKVEDIDERAYPQIADRPLCEKQFMEVVAYVPDERYIFNHRELFGKTIFLTREEAEAALRQLLKKED